MKRSLRTIGLLCLLVCVSASAQAQIEADLTAKQRLFPGLGPGVRSIRHTADGKVYVLSSPSPGLVVFDSTSKQLLTIGPSAVAGKPAGPAILFGEDCDVDDKGRVYVADRGANQVLIFGPDGSLIRSIPVNSPISVAVMPENEIAVATLRSEHLVTVFDLNGRVVREFGDAEQISERTELNRFLSTGFLAADGQGHVDYAFAYLPEPTVRVYDRFGFAGQEIQYTALEAMPEAQALRREIEKQEKRGDTPKFKRVVTALGVDRSNGEVWIALYNTLLHFDKDGNRRASYMLYTPQGARLDATLLLIEKDRILVGDDPLGIYEFSRPDEKRQP